MDIVKGLRLPGLQIPKSIIKYGWFHYFSAVYYKQNLLEEQESAFTVVYTVISAN